MRALRLMIVFALTIALAAPAVQASSPTATESAPIPTVGALYFPSVLGLGPALGLPHECTASVVHSPQHDLVLTAAHCVAGVGLGYQFAPAYHDGVLPYGIWSVTRVYVNHAWLVHHDAQHDYAFLRIKHRSWDGAVRDIEDVVGANTLGSAPSPATIVTVDGYAAGSGDRPLTCTTSVYYAGGFPAFDCDGFVDGTSGSPWLVGTPGSATIVGVIGGPHLGGCTASTSYSSAFGADIQADWQRAASGGTGDFAPLVLGDGCGSA
jgi:hypothetical protein